MPTVRLDSRLRRILHRLRVEAMRLAPPVRTRACSRVLVLHGVDDERSRRFNQRFVRQRLLDRWLGDLQNWADVVSIEHFFEEPHAKDRATIALTFDDGYRNFLTHALPVLERHGVPATLFVTAARARGQEALWTDRLDLLTAFGPSRLTFDGVDYRRWRGDYRPARGDRRRTLKRLCKDGDSDLHDRVFATLMDGGAPPLERLSRESTSWALLSEEELRQVAGSPLVEIGAHGVSHCALDALSEPAALREAEESKAWLEGVTGEAVRSWSYPDGRYQPKLVEALSALGYERQLLVNYAFGETGTDGRLAERIGLHPTLPWRAQKRALLRGRF